MGIATLFGRGGTLKDPEGGWEDLGGEGLVGVGGEGSEGMEGCTVDIYREHSKDLEIHSLFIR